jgi:hypothetical protein
MIPGFKMIKNGIITPLLFASEKVVEYILPEEDSQKRRKVNTESSKGGDSSPRSNKLDD